MSVVLFVREDLLLKASHKKLITVPGHVRNGKWINPYQANVLVSDDHDDLAVSTGQGSFYQKQAHKKLVAELDHFHALPHEDKAAIILSHATDMQIAASASAAVSGWKKAALAGENPSKAQWAAFHALPMEKQEPLLTSVEAKAGKLSHLSSAKAGFVKPQETTSVAKTEKAEQASQGQSQEKPATAAVIDPLAGPTVDTPIPADAKKTMDGMFADGHTKALQAVADNNSANPHVAAYAQKLLDRLKTEPVGPKEGDTKTENGKTYTLYNGKWHRTDKDGVPLSASQHGAAAHAQGIKSPMSDPDFVAVYGSDQTSNKLITAMSSWHKGADKEAELAAALVAEPSIEIKIQHTGDGYPMKPTTPAFESTIADIQNWIEDGNVGQLQDAVTSLTGLTSKSAKAALAYAEAGVRYLQKKGDGANHKAAVTAMETGSFYQKEALKKLKAEHGPSWDALHPSKQHELAHGKYQALQGAASQAAAVSGWKKHMLAGQVPTPSEVKAFAAMAAQDSIKAGNLMVEVQNAIGGDKMAVLVSQAHAKMAQAAKAPVSAPKVFVTTPPAAPSLADKPAYDHLAQSIASLKGHGHSLPAQKTYHKLAAQDWMAANPSKGAEMYEALADHKLSHLAAMVGPDVKPPATNPAKNDAKAMLSQPLQDFVMLFKFHGGPIAQGQSLEQLLADEQGLVSVFKSSTSDVKSNVAAAISFYGPHKLKLFMDWMSAENDKDSAPKKVPVKAQVFNNTLPGHNKFWSVSTHGKTMMTTYGKIGTKGSTTTKEFHSPEAAVIGAGKLKDEKVAKGYKYGGESTHVHETTATAPATKVATTAGWMHQESDGAYSGAPSLSIDTADGGNLYAAHDGDVYQVGVVSADGNPVSHDDFKHPEDAAAQLAILAVDHGLPLPTLADVQKLAVAGPKDGDTKPGADGSMLVFKNGRWHKQGVVIPDFTSLTAGKWGPIYNNVAAALKDAVDAGGFAALKKHVVFHKNGRVSIAAANAKLNHLSAIEPGYSGAQKLRREAMHKLVMDLTSAAKGAPKGKKVVFTTGSPAAAASKPAAAAQPAKPAGPKVFVTKDANAASGDAVKKNGLAAPKVVSVQDVISSNVADIGGWKKTGAQEGSNPGGYFTDTDGQQWYCKFPKDPDAAKSELLAIKLYAACGIEVPSMKAVMLNGKPGVASKVITGLKKSKDALASTVGTADGFAVDAWLANWDAVGLGFDNLQIKAGKAVRVDVGGSLDYRAQGAKKGAAFGSVVTELKSMRDHATNSQSAHVFGALTNAQIGESAKHIFRIKDTAIIKLCNAYGPGSITDKSALAQKLIDRKNDLAAKFPAAFAEFAPKISVVLPTKPNFKEWNGPGKGLSSKAVFNDQNQEIVDKMYAIASTGSVDDLANMQYQPINESGAPTGPKVPVANHKSQHIPQFLQDVVSSIKNPVAVMPRGLKDAEIDAGGGGLFGSLLSFFDDVKSLASSAYNLGRYAITGKIEGDGLFDSWQYTPKSMKNGALSAAQHYKDSMANFKKLPQTQQDAIRAYTGSAHSTMNNPLTGVGTHGSTDFAIDGIDKASIPLEEGTVLSRKFSFANDSDGNLQKLMQSEGCLLKDFGIISTAMTPGTWSGAVQLHITCAEGVRGLYVAKNPEGGGSAISNHASENEIILPYGTKFFVKKVHKENHSFTDEHGSWGAQLIVEVIALPN